MKEKITGFIDKYWYDIKYTGCALLASMSILGAYIVGRQEQRDISDKRYGELMDSCKGEELE